MTFEGACNQSLLAFNPLKPSIAFPIETCYLICKVKYKTKFVTLERVVRIVVEWILITNFN